MCLGIFGVIHISQWKENLGWGYMERLSLSLALICERNRFRQLTFAKK